MKRVLDVVVSTLLALALAPLLVVVVVTVRWQAGSPALFRQQRAGRYGRPFTLLKIRTMRPPVYRDQGDDERLIRHGGFLRRTSLDELPQLWNVLRGEMSLVGPRPTLPEQVAHYTQRQRGRLSVRPGLSGWAQVKGRNSLTWPERIELDLWYVTNRSLLLDLRILGLTVIRVLRPSGITGPGGENFGFPHPLASSPPTARSVRGRPTR